MRDVITVSQGRAHRARWNRRNVLEASCEENNGYVELLRTQAVAKTHGNSTAICSNVLAIANNMNIILRKAQVRSRNLYVREQLCNVELN